MKKLSALTLFAAIIILSGCGRKVTQKDWYDYGNGVVNLSNISNIQTHMEFALFKTNDRYDKTLASIEGSISKTNIEKIREAVKKYSGEWTSIKYNAFISFDLFKLKLPDLEATGLSCTDEGCIQLTELWFSEYTELLDYIDAYNP